MARSGRFFFFFPSSLLLALLLVQGAIEAAAAEDDDYFEKCCELGSARAKRGCATTTLAGNATGLPDDELPACLETADICCRRAVQERACGRGKADARAGLGCARDPALGTEFAGAADHLRDCCEGCKLGILTGSSGKGCLSKKFSLGIPWDPAFMECCKEAMTSTTQSNSNARTTNSTLLITIGVSDTTLESNELFNNLNDTTDFDTSVTQDSYDLCQIMRGLLCSDICISTPGSYYCKCHEGSILQEDGRSCKSNAITKEEQPHLTTLPTAPKTTKHVNGTTLTSTTFSTKSSGPDSPIPRSTPNSKSLLNKSVTTGGYTLASTLRSINSTTSASGKKLSRMPLSQSSALKSLVTRAKSRTTRSAATEDNELSPLCPNGYRVSSSTCDDIDECVEGTHDCGEQKCYNLPGSFQCAKAPVPILRKKSFTTFATTSTGQGTAANRTCKDGFRYDPARKACLDVDECKDLKNACSSTENCENTVGSFECTCRPGFRKDELTLACVDLNECQLENHCLASQRCSNTIGSYICVRFLPCGTGYTLNAHTENCDDDDECSLGTHDCPTGYHCRNTLGSYRCYRNKPGTTAAATTKRPSTTPMPTLSSTIAAIADARTPIINLLTTKTIPITTSTLKVTTIPWETSAPEIMNATWTTDTPKSIKVPWITSTPKLTKAFWTTSTPKPTSTPLTTSTPKSTNNPWTTSTQQIITTPKSTTTTTPKSILTTTVRTTTKSTPRIIPTVKNPFIIAKAPTPRTTTKVTPKITPKTYIWNKFTTTTTEEIPTVASLITTSKSPKVTVSIRSRTICPPGFESGPLGQCIDIDECHRNSQICGSLLCVNTLGSYRCELRLMCRLGYFVDPVTGECKDLDECAQGLHKCGLKQTCQNRDGGYVCVCPLGYEISRTHDCVDINECTEIPGDICGTSGRCVNTPGSYRCDCKPGFESDPSGLGCRDVNECQTTPGICQQECHNTWGGHMCRCRAGYRLKPDNRTCEDIDECTEFKDNNLCIGICDNTPGSYNCRCPDGYRLDNDQRTCLDIDECVEKDVCNAKGEICQNIRGGYRCNKVVCPPYYVNDPLRKNRCVRETATCSIHDKACLLRPAHYSFNYITIMSMYPIPRPSGHVPLFTMQGAFSIVGSTVRFNLAFVGARAPPHVAPATESCFAVQRPYPAQAVLVLAKSLQGPQDIELEFSMEVYGPNGSFAGSAVAKIFIIVTQYEF